MPISAEAFRSTLRLFAAGVTIVTIQTEQARHGLTATGFVSVSQDPPLIGIVIDHRGRGYDLLEQPNAVFAVNFLRADQAHLAQRFATSKEDRFAEGNWSTAETGAPVLLDALAWLDCTVHSRHSVGNNTIYIGKIQANYVMDDEVAPLLYWNRAYRELPPSS